MRRGLGCWRRPRCGRPRRSVGTGIRRTRRRRRCGCRRWSDTGAAPPHRSAPGCMAFPPTSSALCSVAELHTADAVAGRGATPHEDRQLKMLGNVVAAHEHAGASQPAWLGHRPVGRWGFAEQLVSDGRAGELARGRAVAARSAWTPTLPQVPNRVAPPRSTTKEPRPWGRVTNSRDPATKLSQALGSLKTKRAAWPGRSTTRDPADPPGWDGAVTGCPWEPSSRTPGMPLTVQLLAEVLRSWTVYQM